MAITSPRYIVQPLANGFPGILAGSGAPSSEVYPVGLYYIRLDASGLYTSDGAGTWTAQSGVTDAELAAIAGLTSAANKSFRFTGSGTAELIDNADAAAAIGGSTAAAGTTTADAGVLPAATARTYLTTGADDTKGVRIHVDDKVTGRTIHIANGVANKILKVYGPSGASINGAAADAAFSSASGKGVIIQCTSSASNTWVAW